jgi:hypothetical protein
MNVAFAADGDSTPEMPRNLLKRGLASPEAARRYGSRREPGYHVEKLRRAQVFSAVLRGHLDSPRRPLDLVNGNPTNRCHLRDRHAVLQPSADAGELRVWDRRRHPRRRTNCGFHFLTRDRWRRDAQDTQFGCRCVGGLNALHCQRLQYRPLRCEKRFGCLTRSRDPRAIITPSKRRLLWFIKQRYLLRQCSALSLNTGLKN